MDENKKKEIRWSVFIPAFSFVLIAAIIGIVNNEALTSMSNTFFAWSLESFGWLYQITVMAVFIITFQNLEALESAVKMQNRNILSEHGLL